MAPAISVICVNFNGARVLLDCLRGLQGQRFTDFELIFVDNASSDESLELITRFEAEAVHGFPCKIITMGVNTGFATGNTEGLTAARGVYIATVNPDTIPDERWLGELASAINEDRDTGICASKLIQHDDDSIDSAGDGFSKLLQGFKRGEGERGRRFDRQGHVFGACAGAALYRREMLEEIGFFDEDFFLIHEDTDLNLRAQLAGWKTLYVPTAVVEHKVRSSIGHMSDTAVYYTIRNRDFVRIKNVPLGVFLACLPEFLFGVISEFFYFAIKHRRFNLYFKAKCDAIRMFPKMLGKRKEIMKHKRVGNRYLLSIMTPVWNRDFFRAKLKKFFYG